MKTLVYSNNSQEHYQKIAKKIFDNIKQNGITLFNYYDNNTQINDIDLVISIGGDGTLLQASKIALKHNIPILGINAGRRGYLCKFNSKEVLKNKIDIYENITISKRDILKTELNGKTYLALNDFLFISKNAGHSIATYIKTKAHVIKSCSSGVIIATPTGSTGYNASSCNCVLDSNVPCNIITPICAIGEERRSYVISNNETITIGSERPQDQIDIYCDGIFIGTLQKELKITKYNRKLKLVI